MKYALSITQRANVLLFWVLLKRHKHYNVNRIHCENSETELKYIYLIK